MAGVLLAFLRLTTHPAVFPRPLTVREATEIVRAWLAQPAAIVVDPTTRHADLLAGLLAEAGTAANLVGDAHLAALALDRTPCWSPSTPTSGVSPGCVGRRPEPEKPADGRSPGGAPGQFRVGQGARRASDRLRLG